jgi:hypothetical protein
MSPTTKTDTAELSKELLQAFDSVNGYHAGSRPAHAKGILLSGVFHARSGRFLPHQGASSSQLVHLGYGSLFRFRGYSRRAGQ